MTAKKKKKLLTEKRIYKIVRKSFKIGVWFPWRFLVHQLMIYCGKIYKRQVR